jgi:hypothetical protein
MTNYLIRNCKFRYKCKEQWQDLDQIDPSTDHIRFCRVCQENVYLCENDQALRKALMNDHCVALVEKMGDEMPTMVGKVDSGYDSGRGLKWD